MIITLCRRGLLKVYASFCELNISFYKTLTFRFADYTPMSNPPPPEKKDNPCTLEFNAASK